MKTTAVKPQGITVCLYCGKTNPDSEETCPNTGGRHTLVSGSDKSSQISTGKDTPYDPKKSQAPKDEAAQRVTGEPKKATFHHGHGFEPGNDSIVRHCPFCGSGNVWGKSDGNVHCQFCNKDYTVQIQPEYPQAAQNLNGVPLGIGGIEDGSGAAGGPPGAEEDDQGAPGFLSDDDEGDNEDKDDEGSPEDEEDQGKSSNSNIPPNLKKKTSLEVTGVRKGWPIGKRLDRHFLDSKEDGGHGWDEEKLKRLPSTWRQERHDWAHGLGAVNADTEDDHLPENPGHEHWHEDDEWVKSRKGDMSGVQRYRVMPISPEAKLFFTAKGDVLDTDDMINHLAIRHADNPTAVIGMVREFNSTRRS